MCTSGQTLCCHEQSEAATFLTADGRLEPKINGKVCTVIRQYTTLPCDCYSIRNFIKWPHKFSTRISREQISTFPEDRSLSLDQEHKQRKNMFSECSCAHNRFQNVSNIVVQPVTPPPPPRPRHQIRLT